MRSSSPRRLTILSPTSGTPRNKQNLIFSPRDTDGDSEIEAFLEKLQKKTSHSVIGPPFVTRLEGGRKHGSYGPDTQVTSADLMHAYKQQVFFLSFVLFLLFFLPPCDDLVSLLSVIVSLLFWFTISKSFLICVRFFLYRRLERRR